MADRIPGELVALVSVPDIDGTYRTAALLQTAQGPQVGVLVGPRNGTAGQFAFEPVPRLEEGLRGLAEYVALVAEAHVPAAPAAGVDPNDPRGIRNRTRQQGRL